MAEYCSLEVPSRSYSRFSCKSYKVVRDEGGRGGNQHSEQCGVNELFRCLFAQSNHLLMNYE